MGKRTLLARIWRWFLGHMAYGDEQHKQEDGWKQIEWEDFFAWAAKQGAPASITTFGPVADGAVRATFASGAVADVQSEYDGPWSDVTPGSGIEPPTVWIKEKP